MTTTSRGFKYSMITGQVLSKLRRALRNNSKSDVCAVLCDVDLTSTSYEGYEPGVPLLHLLLESLLVEPALLHLLLQHPDVDVNCRDKEGGTVLMAAVLNENLPAVKVLLEQPGMECNLQNKFGMTALMWALASNSAEIITLLLDHPGVDVNVQVGGGRWR